MTKYSWSEIKSKIEKDLDLEGEDFISSTELLGYANDAIDEAEAEIINTAPDYFLSFSSITLVKGTSEYALPTDIYANKIRKVMYNNGSTVYPIERIKNWHKIEQYELGLNNTNSTMVYSYILINNAASGIKLCLSPKANESGAYVKVWYTRNAARLTSSLLDTNVCDIPEFISFIYAYMKWRCYLKEGHPNLPEAEKELEKQRVLMKTTLDEMVPDAEDEIEADLSIYDEME